MILTPKVPGIHKNSPKLPFLVQGPKFWKKTIFDTCNHRIL